MQPLTEFGGQVNVARQFLNVSDYTVMYRSIFWTRGSRCTHLPLVPGVLELKEAWPLPFYKKGEWAVKKGWTAKAQGEGSLTGCSLDLHKVVYGQGFSSYILNMSVEVLRLDFMLLNKQLTRFSSPCSQVPSLTMATYFS